MRPGKVSMAQTSGRKIFPVPDPQGGQPEILSLVRITCLVEKVLRGHKAKCLILQVGKLRPQREAICLK